MAVFIPDSIRGESALEYFKIHREYLLQLLKKQSDLAELAVTGKDIVRITKQKKCAVLLAVESGAVLAGKKENVDYLAACGVTLMTLVWNGENELGSGNETVNGLTPFGKEVIKKMEQKHIIVDVSHLNDRGFSDVCDIAERPFIATHSNLRSICDHKRNLTEKQFQEIIRRKGLVGINLYEPFLIDEGEGTMDAVFRHVYRMLELGGEDVVACGSDFDGADIHESLASPVKWTRGADYLERRGIAPKVIKKMYFDNAKNFFTTKNYKKG